MNETDEDRYRRLYDAAIRIKAGYSCGQRECDPASAVAWARLIDTELQTQLDAPPAPR